MQCTSLTDSITAPEDDTTTTMHTSSYSRSLYPFVIVAKKMNPCIIWPKNFPSEMWSAANLTVPISEQILS